jgi:hypothetical protein
MESRFQPARRSEVIRASTNRERYVGREAPLRTSEAGIFPTESLLRLPFPFTTVQ